MLILFVDTPPQTDTLGAFAPLLGMMGLALLIALLLNLWHFYDFDRHEQQRRQPPQMPPEPSTPLRRRRRRVGAARARGAQELPPHAVGHLPQRQPHEPPLAGDPPE